MLNQELHRNNNPQFIVNNIIAEAFQHLHKIETLYP
jgi:hypothetical protein